MSDAYEAGAPLDADAQAFLDKEGATGVVDEPAKRPEPTPDYTPADDPKLKDDPATRRKGSEVDTFADQVNLAEAMGWAPKEQWKGDPKKWVDADTFLKRGENNPKLLRERLEAQERKNTETIKQMERMNQQALERQKQSLNDERDRLIAYYAQQGDAEAVQHVVNQHTFAVEQVEQNAQPAPAQSWERYGAFQTDPVFAAAAFQICENNKTLSAEEQLKLVDEQLSKRFPEHYQGQASAQDVPAKADTGAPPADGRQLDGVRVSKSRSTNYAARLPAAARSQGERFVKEGLYKNLEEFAKEYANA